MKTHFYANTPLALSLILGMLVVAPEAPLWVSLFAIIILGYKFLIEKFNFPKLSRRVTSLLSVLLLLQILFQYKSVFVQEASTTLLIGLTALKIMDFENKRDLKFLFLLGFVLVALKPLYNIDFYWMVPAMACFLGLWWSLLIELPKTTIPHRFNFLIRLFLSAMPMTIALFIIFPRFIVPWAQNNIQSTGQIGFTDELNPGLVAEIAANKNLVFRAKFKTENQLKTKDLYWRGAVLHQSQGLSWRVGKNNLLEDSVIQKNSSLNRTQQYEVLLEPLGQKYLFGLEPSPYISASSIEIKHFVEGVSTAPFRITKPLFYTGSYEPAENSGIKEKNGNSEDDKDVPTAMDLKFPELPSKTKNWIQITKSKTKTKNERIAALVAFFKEQGFSYTLKPGFYQSKNSGQDLENFLFENKKGFCEHFAGSFASLARALEIPSRVITGFHGGAYNAQGEFWRLTTQDAHAWVEVYLDDKWIRYDPTQWVAPLRLEIGAEAYFGLSDLEKQTWNPETYQRNKSNTSLWWDYISNQLELINYKWTQFLLEYGTESETHILKDSDSKNIVFTVLIVMSFLLIPFFLKQGHGSLNKQEILSELFQDLFLWAEKVQIIKEASEPPLSFSEKLIVKFQNRKNSESLVNFISALSSTYARANYKNEQITPTEIELLKRQWKTLKRSQLNGLIAHQESSKL